ncbi:MAG: hypothetical protein KDD44_09490 [Bdellovibrionales bacterium]|nr:hypothetical protein [Bdellovibrionales bacterium]
MITAHTANCRVLILAAFEPELTPLRQLEAAHPSLSLHSVGVGMVEAALGTTRLLAALPDVSNTEVLFIGSAGALSPELQLLTPVVASFAALGDPSLARGESYLPDICPTTFPANELSSLPFLGISRCGIATPASISATESLAALLQEQTKASAENLELFGVATACASFGVPWSALSVITNHVGPAAHQQWKQNMPRAAEITAELISKELWGE